MKKSLLLMACAVFFTGCTVRGPSVELPSVSVPSVDIESPVKVVPSGTSGSGYKGGKGCPPGLAKKGRC